VRVFVVGVVVVVVGVFGCARLFNDDFVNDLFTVDGLGLVGEGRASRGVGAWFEGGLGHTEFFEFFGVSRFRYTRVGAGARRVDGSFVDGFFLEAGLVTGSVLTFNKIDFGFVGTL